MQSKNLLLKIEPCVATHDGKEKIMRVAQYFLMFFLKHLDLKKNKMNGAEAEKMKAMIAKLSLLYSSMSNFRGIYRFGMYIPTIVKIANRIQAHRQKPV